MAISSMPAFVKSCNIQRERDKVVIDSPWKRAQAGRVSDSAFLLPDGPMVLTLGKVLRKHPRLAKLRSVWHQVYEVRYSRAHLIIE